MPKLNVDLVTSLTATICLLVLFVTFKYINLHIKISNFLDVQLKANKIKEEPERKPDSSSQEQQIDERD